MATEPKTRIVKKYFVKYVGHNKKDRMQSVMGHMFFEYPKPYSEISKAIEEQVLGSEFMKGAKKEDVIIIYDSFSVVDLIV
jgi:hypothetical protein